MGVRVFKLAKELGMTSKELMTYLRTQGHTINNHMCTIDETVAQILRDRLPKKAGTESPSKKKVARKQKTKSVVADSNGKPAAEVTTPPPQPAARKKPEEPRTKKPRVGTQPKPAKVSVGPPDAGEGSQEAAAPRPANLQEETFDEKATKVKGPKPTRKRFFPGASDYSASAFSHTSGRRAPGGAARRVRRKSAPEATAAPVLPRGQTEAAVQLPITVKELSSVIGVKVPNIIKFFMMKGTLLSLNSYVQEVLLEELGDEFAVKIRVQKEKRLEDSVQKLEERYSSSENLVARAPVVTFLGHVDHGKTSLLDTIRKTKVASKEHGGITQHLGAYRVDVGNVHVVFIDTPGHKAFTEMRARGTNVTDVVVLVVAADEGPMPQTEEAYNHAVAAGVPTVVALNKIDRPNANPTKAKEQLSKLGLMPVEWGGKTEFVEVSAQTGEGIDNLLETLSLEAEILELKAAPALPAIGVVLEAESNPGRGNLATVLVQNGTLRLGDLVLCGVAHGKIRSMWMNGRVPVEEAGPSSPVQVSGLNVLPEVGDKLYVFESLGQAREIAEERQRKRREEDRASAQKVSLQNLWEKLEKSEVKELKLIVKADVRGTLEALKKSLLELGNEEVQVRILHAGVGAVSQDDVLLADASDGVILGFNVNVDDRSRTFIDEKHVELRLYSVIYELLDDVKRAIEDRLDPEVREVFQGRVEILQVFRASKIGKIAGCMVRKGNILRDSKVRVLRDDEVIHTGSLSSLKRFKDDIKEVKEGYECGLKIAGYDDIQEGDLIEAFTTVEEKRSL